MKLANLSALDRHQRIALSFSGGKDSLACVYLLRDRLSRITLYHIDPGDQLPETREIVEHVKAMAPNFIHLRGDIEGWIAANGHPTDLMPYSAHPVGRFVGQAGARLVERYTCCIANLMQPLYARIQEDGNTLLIRGTKASDMPRLATRDGEVHGTVEIMHPIEDWTDSEVLDYLRDVGAPVSRLYEHGASSPDCARCTAWWGERRAAYLRRFYPEIFTDYMARMTVVAGELAAPIEALQLEMAAMEGGA